LIGRKPEAFDSADLIGQSVADAFETEDQFVGGFETAVRTVDAFETADQTSDAFETVVDDFDVVGRQAVEFD
jgi:hypothetical protein